MYFLNNGLMINLKNTPNRFKYLWIQSLILCPILKDNICLKRVFNNIAIIKVTSKNITTSRKTEFKLRVKIKMVSIKSNSIIANQRDIKKSNTDWIEITIKLIAKIMTL